MCDVNGGFIPTGANAMTFAGTVTLLSSQTITTNIATTITGNILEAGGGRSLTQNGIGTLTLNAASAYSGGSTLTYNTQVPLGTVVLGGPTVLGTGTVTITNGTIQASSVFAIPNVLSFNGGVGSLVTFGGSNPLTFTNASAGNSLAGGTNAVTTLMVNTPTTFNTAFNGSVGSLVILGSNTLTLTQPAAYIGTTTIGGGTLVLSGAGALTGTASVTVVPTAYAELAGANLVTVTVANNFVPGQTVTIANAVPATYNGTYAVQSAVPGSFTYYNPTTGIAAGTTFGTVTASSLTGTPVTTAVQTLNTIPSFPAVALPVGALTEAVNVVTVVAANNFIPGQSVTITGVTPTAYNGTYTITAATSAQFTYTNPTAGLGASTTVGAASVMPAALQTFTLSFNNQTTAPITLVPTVTPATGAISQGGNTVTVNVPNNFTAGQNVTIAGVAPNGFNGTFTILTASTTNFTYFNPAAGLAASTTTGTASVMPAAIQAALGNLPAIGASAASTVAAVAVPGATESGNTVTITTTAAHGFLPGQLVNVTGVAAGYNGVFEIMTVPSTTTFTYESPTTGLANAGGGTVVAYTNAVVAGVNPYQIAFQGALASQGVPLLVVNGTNVPGTTTPNVTVVMTTIGAPIAVNNGGVLTLDNTATNNTTRIPGTSEITLNGGTFNLVGNSGAVSSQTFTTPSSSTVATRRSRSPIRARAPR